MLRDILSHSLLHTKWTGRVGHKLHSTSAQLHPGAYRRHHFVPPASPQNQLSPYPPLLCSALISSPLLSFPSLSSVSPTITTTTTTMLVLIRKNNPTTLPMSTHPHSQSSTLLTLPTELRLQIWELLLIQPNVNGNRNTNTTNRFCSNILLTCKQINAEGTPILYGENTFLAHPSLLSALPSFLLHARPQRVNLPPVKHSRVAQMIRKFHLVVRLDTDPRFTRLIATESFSNIDILSIEVFQAMYGSCDFSVLTLFEGIRGVGKAMVSGSVGDGRYARWLEQSMMSKHEQGIEPYNEEYVGGVPSWDAWSKGNR